MICAVNPWQAPAWQALRLGYAIATISVCADRRG